MSIPFESYETVIGFECHVQLNTSSKLFSFGPNDFGNSPNSILDVVDAGLPGVLPSINQKAVESAVLLGMALSCDIRNESVFSRKHYFYPDLPKGYQISQFDRPICENGELFYLLNGEVKSVRITRIHIEEDAGKNTHSEGNGGSYVDFNRAGTPLLEVVSEPELRTPEEAMAAFKALRQLVVYLGICDGNMQEGSLRADINVSVRKVGDKVLGTRTETKNLNSFKFLGQAIAFESRRQIVELEAGKKIVQETRLWDPGLKESRSMRSKEEAHDYRYFPDPDLPTLRLSKELLEKAQENLNELPHQKYLRYQSELGLSAYDAEIISSDVNMSSFFEECISLHPNSKATANWIINELLKNQGSQDADQESLGFSATVSPQALAKLIVLIDDKVISNSIAKKVFAILIEDKSLDPKDVVEKNSWQVVSSQDEILCFVDDIIKNNADEVKKYREGKTKVFGFLMGQLMQASQGKIDPKEARELLLKKLGQI